MVGGEKGRERARKGAGTEGCYSNNLVPISKTLGILGSFE